jgi:hypothetical protein
MSDELAPVVPSTTAGALLPTAASDIALDDLLQKGDFSGLTMRERSIFTYQLAKRLNLNPLTKPFDFIVLNNKLTLYANRTCSDQLRKNHNITSAVIYEGPLMLGQTTREDVYCVRVRLFQNDDKGNPIRTEEAIGCVGLGKKSDEELGNAIMKCHTKALRRGTLAFCGLGFLDELEVESVKGLEGGVGSPRRVEVTPLPQEAFPEDPEVGKGPIPSIAAVPVAARQPVPAKPLPQAGAPSAQPAAPKLPSVLPAVKP